MGGGGRGGEREIGVGQSVTVNRKGDIGNRWLKKTEIEKGGGRKEALQPGVWGGIWRGSLG